MEQIHNDLVQHLEALSASFSQLRIQLLKAADDLHEPGTPPPEELLESVVTARNEFMAIYTRIIALAQSLAIPVISTAEQTMSLKDVNSLLRAIIEAEDKKKADEQIRIRALAVLDHVLTIVHSDRIDFAPLMECQAQARDLYRAIADLPLPQIYADAESLAFGHHPFAELLTFVGGLRELDDERWQVLHDAVAGQFGAALVVAIVRGKVHLPQESLGTSSSLRGVQAEEAAPLVEAEHLIVLSTVEQPSSDVESKQVGAESSRMHNPTPLAAKLGGTLEQKECDVEDVTTAPTPEEIEGLHQRTVREVEQDIRDPGPLETMIAFESPEKPTDRDSDVPYLVPGEIHQGTYENVPIVAEGATAEPFYRFPVEETAQQIAATVLGSTVTERPTSLRDLIWRLIFEDKVGLAFHLTCCTETLYPELQPLLPSWLVRAVALGQHVRHASGDVARLLKQDFGQFSEACFMTIGGEWNHAVRFLCAAGALRPALLAPDTHASTVLTALHMKEGLSQLYEYCQIIATYGDQLQSLDPNALKNVKDQAAWHAEVDALRQEVAAWSARAPQMTIAAPAATKVWRKWQERQGLIYSLLLPVRENDTSRLQAAKQAVEQLSDDTQIKREVDHTDRKVLGGRGGVTITARVLGQIRMHVLEAVGFVRRWIELQEACPGRDRSYLQKRADQLRQEVWNRQTAVLDELAAFEQQNPSLPILSGIMHCRKALDSIRTLFDPEAPLSVEESDPRYLLHVDLLHLDTFPLNDQWEPEIGAHQLILDRILSDH